VGAPDLATQIQGDHGSAPIEEKWKKLLDHARKLTLAPAECGREDVATLREAGFTDEEIHDGIQVAAYFNYINRVADALGVDPEPETRESG
jgi:uncharacterized peroxidase-related enzyme